jgi:ABC-2 type transport system permease protein
MHNDKPVTKTPKLCLRRTKALILKEFIQMVRDPSSLLIGFGLPMLLMFIYGFGVSLDVEHLRIGLVLEDATPDTYSFAKSLTNSTYFDVKIARHRRELENDIVSGAIRGFVVIPSYFTQFEKKHSPPAPIQVIADGSETNTASFVHNYVRGAWDNWREQQRLSNGQQRPSTVNAIPRFWYNEELQSRNFLIPGSIAIIMAVIGTLLTALVVSREWERGTMEALMSSPVHIVEILIGKLIPYFILGMGAMALTTFVAIFLYGVPFRGSFLVLAGVSAIFLLTGLEVGLLISTLTRNQFASSQAAFVFAFLPAFMLSGFIFEIASMPPLIRAFTYLFPARYFVSSLQTLFLVGNVRSLILYNVGAMAVFGAVMFMIIAKRTVKRLD